jgi:hypothetical protein
LHFAIWANVVWDNINKQHATPTAFSRVFFIILTLFRFFVIFVTKDYRLRSGP